MIKDIDMLANRHEIFVLDYSRRHEEAKADSSVRIEVHEMTCAAIEYLDNAGISERESYLYDLAVASLATHWMDNRDAISAGTVAETPIGLRAIINQLKLIPPSVPDSGTEV